MWNMLLFKNKE